MKTFRGGIMWFGLLFFPVMLWGQHEATLRSTADSAYAAGDYSTSQRAYSRLKSNATNPDTARFFALREARSAVQGGAYVEGEALIRAFFALKPTALEQAAACQDLSLAFAQQGMVDSSLKYAQRNISLQTKAPHPDTTIWAKGYDLMAFLHLQKGEASKARESIERAHSLREAFFDPTDLELGYGANTLYIVLDGLGEAQAAEQAAQQAFRILNAHLPKGHPHLAIIANNLSVARADQGDPYAAREYLQQAIETNRAGNRDDLLMENYFNLAYLYVKVEDWANAEVNNLRALAIADTLLPTINLQRSNMLEGLGATSFGSGRLEKADSLFRLTLEMRRQLLQAPDLLLAETYYDLAIVAVQQGKNQQARQYLSTAESMYQQLEELNPSKWADVNYEFAELDWKEGKHTQAFDKWRQTLRVYTQTRGPDHTHTLEVIVRMIEAFEELGAEDSVDHYLRDGWSRIESDAQGGIYPFIPPVIDLARLQFRRELVRENMPDSRTSDRAMALLHWLPEYLALFPPGGTGADLGARVQELYRLIALLSHKALKASPGNNSWENALLIALEATRGARVRQTLQRRQAMAYAGVPDTIVARGNRLVEQLRYWYGKETNEELDEEERNWQGQALQEWESYLTFLEKKYPAYFNVRFQQKSLTLTGIQSDLRDEAIVAYLHLDSAFLIVRINESGLHSVYQPLSEDWYASFAVFAQGNQTAQPGRFSTRVAHQLYEQLWLPVATELPLTVRILPDGPLYGLSFETLLTQPAESSTPYQQLPWLLRDHQLYYSHSLMRDYSSSTKSSYDILGVAPGFSADLKQWYERQIPDRNQLDSVFLHWISTPWSMDFVRDLDEHRWGHGLVGKEATETQVLEAIQQAGIIHFGTHARLRNEDPLQSFLALTPDPEASEDGYLHAFELYQQQWNAQLAVLTACETGLGPYQPGEGLLSLAHAFRYAGCPSVVHSLWSIDDQQTQVLVELFYEKLRDGLPAAAALQQAKLQYLEEQPGQLTASFYWGGLVLTGHNYSQAAPGVAWWQWLGLALIAVGGVNWWLRKKVS